MIRPVVAVMPLLVAAVACSGREPPPSPALAAYHARADAIDTVLVIPRGELARHWERAGEAVRRFSDTPITHDEPRVISARPSPRDDDVFCGATWSDLGDGRVRIRVVCDSAAASRADGAARARRRAGQAMLYLRDAELPPGST